MRIRIVKPYRGRFLALWIFFLWAGIALPNPASAASPFAVSVKAETETGHVLIRVDFKIPNGHFLYAESISVSSEGDMEIVPFDVPAPKVKKDPVTGLETGLYDRDFRALYRTVQPAGAAMKVAVRYQGCSASMCFLPETPIHLRGG